MIDLEEGFGQELAYHAPHSPEPLTIDVRLASSALQKAVRRDNEAEALACTRLLVDRDPQRLWRRLAVIAMEDVGVQVIAIMSAGKRRRSHRRSRRSR